MVQPTDVAVGMLLALWLDLAGWGLVIYAVAEVVAAVIAIVYLIVTWGGVTLGPDPVLPPVVEPATVPIPLPPKAHFRREDADTHVIARIPGATPPQDIADEQLVDGLRELPAGPELVRFLDALDADVRVLDVAAGPVCPFCGGPWHALCPSAPKSAPEEEPTQVVDLCPLTTQDIEIPTAGDAPVHRSIAGREPTQDLTAKILEAMK